MSKRGWPHVDDPIKVGRRLKKARLEKGLSQRELVFPGCTAVYICRIEKGDRVPSLQVIRELAKRLGVEESWLAKGKSPMRTSLVTRRLNPNQSENLKAFGDISAAERHYLVRKLTDFRAIVAATNEGR